MPTGLGSLLITLVLFAELVETLRQQTEQSMPGATPEELAAALAMLTPATQALAGVFGALGTGLVCSPIIAAVVRRVEPG